MIDYRFEPETTPCSSAAASPSNVADTPDVPPVNSTPGENVTTQLSLLNLPSVTVSAQVRALLLEVRSAIEQAGGACFPETTQLGKPETSNWSNH